MKKWRQILLSILLIILQTSAGWTADSQGNGNGAPFDPAEVPSLGKGGNEEGRGHDNRDNRDDRDSLMGRDEAQDFQPNPGLFEPNPPAELSPNPAELEPVIADPQSDLRVDSNPTAADPSVGFQPFQPQANPLLSTAVPGAVSSKVTDRSAHNVIEQYRSETSIAFKPASEVTDEKRTWGIEETSRHEPKSSMQILFVGTVVSVNHSKRQIVVKDKRRNLKTLYVNGDMMPFLKKGMTIQAMLQPGNNRVESLRQVGK